MTEIHSDGADVAGLLQTFLIDHSHIRGQFVRLGEVAETVTERHNYPDAVSRLLSEMLVVVAMLSANLKSQGMLTIQLSGNGPLKFAVVDATDEGNLRGYAEIADGGEAVLADMSAQDTPATLSALFGEGRLMITLDQTAETGGRYQGIVELAGNTLTDAILRYFTQSQQAEMALKLSVRKQDGAWRAAGIMIERLPEEGGTAEQNADVYNAAGDVETDVQEQWNRTQAFMETVEDEEMFSDTLTSWNVLERLFNEDGVWAYKPRALHAVCRCSRERIADILRSLDREELNSMKQDGVISVNCRFCNSTELFDEDELSQIFDSGNTHV